MTDTYIPLKKIHFYAELPFYCDIDYIYTEVFKDCERLLHQS